MMFVFECSRCGNCARTCGGSPGPCPCGGKWVFYGRGEG